MANNSRTQISLANSRHFQSRLGAALTKVAWEVLNENPNTQFHLTRATYAHNVIGNPASYAQSLVFQFVFRTNVFAFATNYDFDIDAVVTASGDPDIESQLASDWNILSGAI